MRFAVVVSSAALAVAGAAQLHAAELTVTYQSDPPGAALYQGPTFMGYTPLTLRYALSKEERKGTRYLPYMRVLWASGASAETSNLHADVGRVGLRQVFTFQRPNVEGREADMQIAIQMQQLALMKRQANAAQAEAYAQRQQQFWNQLAQSFARSHPRPTNCTSVLIGNIIQTNCN